ncbi:hypothetical protein ES288_D05G163000v1 [Gossypium darwinii]|uniref:C-22 sterol desaturase n=1 Tax=Gossypium darwinii TaxID=34276 RepID=A0A5D2CG63_GOSDA|nr:hypothetical protein ES288_D05G163000v1 [Gossypium darwinii]
MVSFLSFLSPFAPFSVTFLLLFLFVEQICYLPSGKFKLIWLLLLDFLLIISSVASSSLSETPSFPTLSSLTSDPMLFYLWDTPLVKKLFGEHNMIYMFGQDHKDLRRQIAPNFTPRALSTYTALQQIIILQHLRSWEHLSSESPGKPISLHLLARDMNLETSQTVFVGRYLSREARKKFRDDYNLFNTGLMKLPFDLPGFAFRNAKLAVERLVETLSDCATQSKKRMSEGDEPSCLIDFWMQETVREIAESKTAPPRSSNVEIGSYLFDFLFAAQDASTSIWSPESDTLISTEQLREMKYTQAVAREVIRYRPPTTLVPHIAMKDFLLTESYTIPKGTIVFPSVIFKRNYLAFGVGPHQCVGQRYALNHLVLFIAMFVTVLDFKRHRTGSCDEIMYCPTICPKDGCIVFLS